MPEVLFAYAIWSHHPEACDNNSSLHATATLLLHWRHLLWIIGLSWLVVLLLWLLLPWLVVRLLWLVVGWLLWLVVGWLLVLCSEPLLPLIAHVLHRIPCRLGTPQRNRPDDEKGQGDDEQDCEQTEYRMEHPGGYDKAQREDQRKRYWDDMGEKTDPPPVRSISIRHL